jgi:hypothetical protein
MSAIASLYGSPKMSMMSRDPDGVDPNGVNDSFGAGLEPSGSRVDESVLSPSNHSHAHEMMAAGKSTLDPVDVVRMVGAPPPPPPTPPPKKIRRRTTPKNSDSKAEETPKTGNVGSFAMSFDEDSLFYSIAETTPRSGPPVEGAEKMMLSHHTTSEHSHSTGSIKIDSPPREQPVEDDEAPVKSPSSNIVEERLKAAMAVYESEDLVLDQESEVLREVLRPAMKGLENQLEVMPELPATVESSPKVEKKANNNKPQSPAGSRVPSSPSPRKVQLSPSSAATRPRSNKTLGSTSPSMSVLSNVNESPRQVKKTQKQSPSPRRTASVERVKAKEEKQKRDQKRGFFKKLFRGRASTREEDIPPVSAPVPRARPSPRSTSSPRSKPSPKSQPKSSTRSRSRSTSRSRSSRGTPRSMASASPRSRSSPKHKHAEKSSPLVAHSPSHSQPHQLKPALKSAGERQYQGPAVPSPLAPNADTTSENQTAVLASPVVESAAPSESPKSAGETTESSEQQPPQMAFSHDPPDDEHGDPPVFSGRPLISPTSYNDTRDKASEDEGDEKSRMESVKSRLAETYESRPEGEEAPEDGVSLEGPAKASQDNNDYFFAQDDELSTLTGTFGSGSKSFGPSGSDAQEDAAAVDTQVSPKEATAESLEEDVDPYTTAFFQQDEHIPDAALPTPTHLSELRVQVQGPSQDPVGASPMKWDSRGQPAMNSGFRDPVGESPLHAWKTDGEDVDDPPLNASFLDEDDSFGEEEKKEDDLVVESKLSTESSAASTVSETPFEKDFLTEIVEDRVSETKATRAALKLAQVTGLDAINETRNAVPTPKNSGEQAKLPAPSLPTSTSPERASLSSKKESQKVAPVMPKQTNGKDLTLQTDVEKSGFKSASNTPVSGKPALSVTTAAFTNAKAVAYLHRLHGEPSPRHTWHASRRKTSDLSPLAMKAKARKAKAKKNQSPAAPGSSKKPSPDEYGAHNFDESQLANDGKVAPKATIQLEELHAVQTKEGALFGAYNSKFQGRKPSKKKAPKVETPTGSRLSLGSRGRLSFSEDQNKQKTVPFYAEVKPGKITGWAVARGISLRRSKRDEDVMNGKSERVVITPREKTEGRNRFNFFPQDESDIKDPIQRAGRRILSKSAIPIQSAARRYIAKRQAIDRMWALIEIQSYYRRWRAETNLQASIHSAVQIQSAFRGWVARDQLKVMHSSATQIQKIVRGYICQAKVYDTIYYIVRIQALLKGCYERKMQEQKKTAAIGIQKYLRGFKARLNVFQDNRVVPIQALYRGHKARQEFEIAIASAKLLQSTWRAYSARITFQIEIVDIIIVQSIVRRWSAARFAQNLRNMELFGPASMIQAAWRGRKAQNELKKNLAARKIQTAWRGFQSYTDYIFSLVDILVVQRTARVWLAKRAANKIRKGNAATKIQCCWRRHKAESTLLYSLVHIIIVQSVARRFLSRFSVQKRRAQIQSVQNAEQQKQNAAIAIQKTWRGFWGFSHFIIIQYEVARLQAIVRGKLARQSYNLKLGCAIIIQATIRRHLAKSAIQRKMVSDAMTESAALALRERNASRRIQFWWRIVLDWTKEKRAALTIERFFIHVRQEVDREIVRRERRKLMKKEKRRQQRRESDEKMLEKAWLNTVDENTAVGSRSENGSRSQSAPRLREGQLTGREVPYRTPALGMKNQLLSPKPSSVGQEVDIHGWPIQRVSSTTSRSTPPTESIPMSTSEDHSEVSNITNPTFFNRQGPPGHYEGNMHGRQSRDKRMSTNDYIKKYGGGGGLQTAPNRMTANGGKPQHFFSDNGSAGSTKKDRPVVAGLPIAILPNSQPMNSTPRSVPGTPTSRRSSSTPRSQSSQGFGPNGTPRALSTPITPGSRSKNASTTPRNNYGASGGVSSTPRGSSSYQVPSPRIQVGFPPATPRSHKGMGHSGKQHIHSRGTAETESQTTYSQNSFSKASPRSRSDGHLVKNGSPVVVMKSYPDFSHSRSMEDSQEVMYLDSAEVGEEYGEV